MNLSTEGLARAASRRPWRTVLIWVALIAAAIATNATLLPSALTNEFGFSNNPESVRADDMLEKRLRGPKKVTEMVVVQSPTHKVDDQPFKDKVEELHGKILALGPEFVQGGVHYYMTGEESLVSEDRGTTLMPFVLTGDINDATNNVEKPLEVVREANGKDGFTVLMAGEASIGFEGNEVAVKDIEQGEKIGVPTALLILVVLFGALIAAVIPVFLAIISITHTPFTIDTKNCGTHGQWG